MSFSHRRRALRARRRGVSNVIAAIMLVAITIVAGTTLWTLHFNFPPSGYYVTYIANAGLKVPAWGDPTDCVPYGYPIAPYNSWTSAEKTVGYSTYCGGEIGNFSLINASSIVFTSVNPATIPLSQIGVEFLCHNTTPVANSTVLVGGSLAAMTWFPGASTSPAPNAPQLGWCGSFDANNYGGGAFGTLYNRLMIFTPIHQSSNVLQPGDTLIVYVHTPGSVYDPQTNHGAGGADSDDFHGAPSWCFTTPGACEIKFLFTGNPNQLLADVPIYSISGAGQ